MESTLISCLSPEYPWKELLTYVPSTDSTNVRLKALARQGAPHGTALIAGHQTAGHGRLGRDFHSPQDTGIYLSMLLRPDCLPGELMHLTCAVAVAVCDALEHTVGFRPGIKWTNDLIHGTRKLGGILTELGFTADGRVDYAVIGIGINCSQQICDFPQEIRDLATSVSMAAGQTVNRLQLTAAILDAICTMDTLLLTDRASLLNRYRADCVTVGKEISLIRGDEIRHGRALDVDEQGALVVAFPDGHTESVQSGEVSIRGMYGYI